MPKHYSRFLTPYVVVSASVVIAIASIAIAFAYTSRIPSSGSIRPTTGPLVEEVDTSGTVTSADTLDLSFQTGGKISYAGPNVGAHVAAGQRLAQLTGADANAALEQAQAAQAVQEANLASLRAGTRAEDIAVTQTTAAGAQASLDQSKASVIAAAQDAYVKADDAVHNKADTFFTNPRSLSPSLVFSLSDQQLQLTVQTQRAQLESMFNDWQAYLSALQSNPHDVDVDALAAKTHANLSQTNQFLTQVALALTKAITTTAYSPSTIQTFQSNITSARTSLTGSTSALDAALVAEKNAQAGLATAQSQVALKQAGATPQALQAQEAQVAVARANVDAARAQLAKTVLSAPISGTITVNNARIGEIAAAGAPLISMISDSTFQLETYVSQADFGKLKVGNEAIITLDAYTGKTFAAKVVAIDPAATQKNGISSYKVTLEFEKNDPDIHQGLTGNAKIVTQNIENALAVPTSAVITQGARHFVLKRSASDGFEQVPVEIGITSANGLTQILSGITATDDIRSFGSQK